MAGKLNARRVETLTAPGRYGDGDNLYLVLSPNGGKRWVLIYRYGGRRVEMGLGSAAPGGVTLANARLKAAEARRVLSEGRNPLAVKRETERAARAIPTFGEAADQYIASHIGKFRNEKHAAQWQTTLGEAFCRALRPLRVDEVDTEAVLETLKAHWSRVPETASRLRGRIEAVLSAATVLGHRSGPNPAAWRGHLEMLLPARQKLTRGHHAALPYDSVPDFMVGLKARDGLAARALELTILTACRTSEVLGARWEEIDFEKKIWTIPAVRMKAGHAHRVPLSGAVMELIATIPKLEGNPHVLPGLRRGKSLSCTAMLMQLRRMGRADITPHGFRSSFRDWAAETTSFPHSTCEHALAHRISDKADSAYRRGDELERRRDLMETWARWCVPAATGNVVVLRTAAGA
jgi:integrase